ncbi:MAG: signal peptide peptidase SppA [Deltaproteobacteria bacterium]|nr:signal peptide peptidase SppA [Deltaproteobacteria bacterium]
MLRLPLILLANLLVNLLVAPVVLLRRLGRPYFVELTLQGTVEARDDGGGFWRRSRGWSVERVERLVTRLCADRKAAGLVVRVRGLKAGLATLRELRETLLRLRSSGKRLVFLLEEAGTREYVLATVGDELLMPEGALLDLRGMSAEFFYFGGLLRRLGVEVEIGQAGRYKSAAERLARAEMSPASREAMERLLEVLFEEAVVTIAEARRVTVERARELVDLGPYDGPSGVAAGLLDATAFADELPARLAPARGGRAQIVPAAAYARRLRLRWRPLLRPRVIAVLPLQGMIVGGESVRFPRRAVGDQTIAAALERLGRTRRVAGVVLHIDSPGGGVTPSELMWRAASSLREKKPVVASLGDVAASGGYYVAVACSHIVAQAETITGSIGVLTGKVSVGPLLRRLGIGWHRIRHGARAALHGVGAPLEEAEREALREQLERTYRRFLQRVADGRKRPAEEVALVAEGRVWAGRDAVDRGLVDELGGLARAIEVARQAARRAPGEPLEALTVRLPGRGGLWSRLLGSALDARLGGQGRWESLLGGPATLAWLAEEPLWALWDPTVD